MSSLDCYNITNFSIDSGGLPRSRIKCSDNKIIIGDNSFISASDALLVYLNQYDVSLGKNVSTSVQCDRRELSQLDQYLANNSQVLCAKSLAGKGHLVIGDCMTSGSEDVDSLLISQVSSSCLREEVNDALREVKLRRVLNQAAFKSHNQIKTDLQLEVEAALLRSAQLLEKVSKEDTSFSSILNSDINSVSKNNFLTLDTSGPKQSGHIYSYRTSLHQKPSEKHSPSKFLHIPASYNVHQPSRKLRRSASIDNLIPSSHKLPPRGKSSFNSCSTSPSYHSDPTEILRSVRSRSVSPSVRNSACSLTVSSLVEQFDQSKRKSVPSWVGDLSPSEISDSLWNAKSVQVIPNDEMSFEIPTWVQDAANGNLPEECTRVCETNTLTPVAPVSSKDNYSSIMNNDLSSISGVTADSCLKLSHVSLSDFSGTDIIRQTTSLDNSRKDNISVDKYRPKHSTPNKPNLKVTFSDKVGHPHSSKMLDSEYTGEAFLHSNILPQTAKLKKSMDKFVASSENLGHRSVSSDLSLVNSGSRSSSLDTVSLLAGKPLSRNELSDCTSVPKDNAIDGHQSPTYSEHGSSDGLDGDRPWEKMARTFKSPVPVIDSEVYSDKDNIPSHTNNEKTLSGRKQPGSMETLKNMLFKLQAEESFTQEESSKNEETSTFNHKNHAPGYIDIIPALHNYDFVKEPGGQSLEKALVHLNRLKKLVQNTPLASSNDENGKTAFTVDPFLDQDDN